MRRCRATGYGVVRGFANEEVIGWYAGSHSEPVLPRLPEQSRPPVRTGVRLNVTASYKPPRSIINSIHGKLRSQAGNGVLLVAGPPGIGKSSLARYVVAHYQALAEQGADVFEDALLVTWTVGDQRSSLSSFAHASTGIDEIAANYQALARRLGVVHEATGEKVQHAEDICMSIRKHLASSRVLLVFDDIWDAEVVRLLLAGCDLPPGQGNKLVVTSRLHSLFAPQAPDFILDDEMNVRAGVLMRQLASVAAQDQTVQAVPVENMGAANELIKACDGSPLVLNLALGLMGKDKADPEEWQRIAGELYDCIRDDARTGQSVGSRAVRRVHVTSLTRLDQASLLELIRNTPYSKGMVRYHGLLKEYLTRCPDALQPALSLLGAADDCMLLRTRIVGARPLSAALLCIAGDSDARVIAEPLLPRVEAEGASEMVSAASNATSNSAWANARQEYLLEEDDAFEDLLRQVNEADPLGPHAATQLTMFSDIVDSILEEVTARLPTNNMMEADRALMVEAAKVARVSTPQGTANPFTAMQVQQLQQYQIAQMSTPSLTAQAAQLHSMARINPGSVTGVPQTSASQRAAAGPSERLAALGGDNPRDIPVHVKHDRSGKRRRSVSPTIRYQKDARRERSRERSPDRSRARSRDRESDSRSCGVDYDRSWGRSDRDRDCDRERDGGSRHRDDNRERRHRRDARSRSRSTSRDRRHRPSEKNKSARESSSDQERERGRSKEQGKTRDSSWAHGSKARLKSRSERRSSPRQQAPDADNTSQQPAEQAKAASKGPIIMERNPPSVRSSFSPYTPTLGSLPSQAQQLHADLAALTGEADERLGALDAMSIGDLLGHMVHRPHHYSSDVTQQAVLSEELAQLSEAAASARKPLYGDLSWTGSAGLRRSSADRRATGLLAAVSDSPLPAQPDTPSDWADFVPNKRLQAIKTGGRTASGDSQPGTRSTSVRGSPHSTMREGGGRSQRDAAAVRMHCNGLTGKFLGGNDKELCIQCTGLAYADLPLKHASQGGCIMSCYQFEKAAGRELSKKWKESIHVTGEGEGSRATLVSWLKRRTLAMYGEGVVGKSVWVCWSADVETYLGTIISFSEDNGKHKVRYSDRFVEELHLPAELLLFGSEQPELPFLTEAWKGGQQTGTDSAADHRAQVSGLARTQSDVELLVSLEAGESPEADSADLLGELPRWGGRGDRTDVLQSRARSSRLPMQVRGDGGHAGQERSAAPPPAGAGALQGGR
ncbi:hypothetical protein WJX72_002598 [[Myrmecia] bisecta]|uniref:NB-ARC domain-containing protein n=1 Tax=[Myrmecia] bisecta TaxID=41462 RepID=A0AAW1Q317_9CHLO